MTANEINAKINDAYNYGIVDCCKGHSINDNPYRPHNKYYDDGSSDYELESHKAWENGWINALKHSVA